MLVQGQVTYLESFLPEDYCPLYIYYRRPSIQTKIDVFYGCRSAHQILNPVFLNIKISTTLYERVECGNKYVSSVE
ncbi:hypothetical protein KUTeg_018479 [Tegillarca granosa]|uniref:Uncharacterized protein n=1 Tax=Tegillarca granosa TaxID=220873 RepID=A0ABQ9EI10_TEGGR|nr:hypothetical protein KUTeg_018479 [Tegillarca granosa]